MLRKICLVRPPALPAYQDTDIKEDPILTSLIGYLQSINYPDKNISVFDFQLDRTISYESIIQTTSHDHYVIVCRDLGESYRYSLRVAQRLSQDTNTHIWLYGQVAPLRSRKLPERTQIVNQFEQELAEKLGLSTLGKHFKKDLNYVSYFDKINLNDWQKKRKKGVIETTRGCPYQCRFCFISAGQNYEKRWQLRSNDSIIQDLKNYIQQDIRSFVFLDSEFLGANPSDHKKKKVLLQRIIDELPPIKYMILCRADTLKLFNEFALLKKSGLSKVLVGVESLYQPDLDALKKDSTVEIMMESITQLIEQEIECCLTYLTFHRNTTLKGLKENLNNIEILYQHPKARYLGMPNFSFNMEVVRDDTKLNDDAMGQLSDLTYIKPLLESRGQKTLSACFPAEMEPLIEIYRLLQYEWVVKKCELIHKKQSVNEKEKQQIIEWFNQLGPFCIKMMKQYLNLFENKQLSFLNLLEEKEILFKTYLDFYSILPTTMNALATYNQHAKKIDYKKHLDMEDHGWDNIIQERILYA